MAEYATLHKSSGGKVDRLETAVAELKSALAAYAREHGGRFILYGSAARREMRADSDVDIMLDFPHERESKAHSFAEEECRRLGLKCDVLSLGWTRARVRERLKKEGLYLPGDENRWARAMSNEDRIGDILDAAQSAAEHFKAAGQLLERGGFDEGGLEGYARGSAVLHAMLRGHIALEDALVRIMKALGEIPPTGSDWHKEVIERAATKKRDRSAILAPDLAAAAQATREFRHFAAHGYLVDFDPEKAGPAIEAAQVLANRFERTIADFVKTIQSN
jgi:predicted nucleotidyltransferase